MPIYDFKCAECGMVSEILIRNLQEDEVECPVCGSQNMEKLISASYLVRTETRAPGTTCCGKTERCQAPPCSAGDACRRD